MKLKRLFILGLVLACAGVSHADDILTVKNVEVNPGESVTLEIELSNTSTNLMGWQCDISLPEGLTLELKENGRPKATLGERFSTTRHVISSSCRANNTYRFIATSNEGDAIPGTSGILFTVTLKADAELTGSPMRTCTVKNIEFNTTDNKKLSFDDVTFFITIPNLISNCDLNGDSEVDIDDAEAIMDYLLGNPPAGFNAAAADVNGDGVVDIADAVALLDILMNYVSVSAPKMVP